MFRFGAFELDPARRQLVREGRSEHLTPKAFELLHLLLGAAPRVVSKEEIHGALWPSSFVADATLVGLVKELRRALADKDPDAPLIRTVHSVGYAFAAPVERRSAAGSSCWLIGAERRFALSAGENVIGRDALSSVWLDAPSVSRRHARIVVDGERVRLEDLGSKNGTTVGAKRVSGACELRDGDRVAFGTLALTFRVAAGTGATVTHVDLPRT
jgi:DNA-binding winged helix-turn-helix (wHTH) protein